MHDLFGAPALLRAAGRGFVSDEEMALLYRARSASIDDVQWTKADAALIDEARVLLGPLRRPRPVAKPGDNGILDGIDLDAYAGDVRAAALREAQRNAPVVSNELDEAEFVTYGHIVIDEAQDLSPMELRVLKRRDLTGSMTIVGDMGQATTASSSASWNAVLEVLEPRREHRRASTSRSATARPKRCSISPRRRCARPRRTSRRRDPVRRAGHAPQRRSR